MLLLPPALAQQREAPPPKAQAALEQRIARAVADLGDAARSVDAVETLERMGSLALPALRAVLQDYSSQKAGREEVVLRTRSALYVLGHLGGNAILAAGDIEALLDPATNPMAEHACWALGQMVGAMPEADIERLRGRIRSHRVLEHGYALSCRLELGSHPEADAILTLLDPDRRSGEPVTPGRLVAVCWVLLGQEQLDERVLRVIRSKLHKPVMAAPAVMGMTNPYWPTAELAEVLFRHGDRDEVEVLGCLLAHWDPDLRRQALVRLRDQRDLPSRWRLAVVRCLWDANVPVRDAALATVSNHEACGVSGLCPLRSFAAWPDNPEFAARCGRAADNLIEAIAALPRDWARLLGKDLDLVVHGLPPAPGARPKLDANGQKVLCSFLCGTLGGPVPVLRQLQPLAAAWSFEAEAMAELLLQLDPADLDRFAAVSSAVVQAVARGVPAETVIPLLQQFGSQQYKNSRLQPVGREETRAMAIEALTWCRTTPQIVGDAMHEVAQAIPRMRLRALVEWAQRGLLMDDGVRRWLTSEREVREWRPWMLLAGNGPREEWQLEQPCDLHVELRAAVALACAAAAVPVAEREDVRAALRALFPKSAGREFDWVKEEAEANRVLGDLQAIEAHARTVMGVEAFAPPALAR